MYEPSAACKLPANGEARIWRYVNIPKLVSLLDTRKLYFSRADLLGDPFEGSHPKKIQDSRNQYHIIMRQGDKDQTIPVAAATIYSGLRRNCFVNCWHANDGESHAMWSVYLKGHPGVAVQSTCNRLIASFDKNDAQKVHVGTVQYIDYEMDTFPDNQNTLHAFMHKHKCYEHEREIRAIASAGYVANAILGPNTVPQGLMLSIDLSELVEQIVLPPDSAPWFDNVVGSLLKRYELDKPVTRSSIPRDAQW